MVDNHKALALLRATATACPSSSRSLMTQWQFVLPVSVKVLPATGMNFQS
jgi:hypothetical protein